MGEPWYFLEKQLRNNEFSLVACLQPVCIYLLSDTRAPREGPSTDHPAIVLVGDPLSENFRELACSMFVGVVEKGIADQQVWRTG